MSTERRVKNCSKRICSSGTLAVAVFGMLVCAQSAGAQVDVQWHVVAGGGGTSGNGGLSLSGTICQPEAGPGMSGMAGGGFVLIGGFWPGTARPCRADFNNSGTVSVQDIFDFLAAYFMNSPQADFNLSGTVSVQDIFDYLAAYFVGC